jgi:hypothetical protein
MPPHATEIAILPLLPDVDISKGDGLKVVQRLLATLKEQSGFKSAVYGLQVEHPDTMTLLIGMTPAMRSHFQARGSNQF